MMTVSYVRFTILARIATLLMLGASLCGTSARAQAPATEKVPESKRDYALSVVVSPPPAAPNKPRVSRQVFGITDDGTIFFFNNEGGNAYPTLQKRRPSGEIVTVVSSLDKLPGGGTCMEIGTVIVGANGDLVMTLLVSGMAPAPIIPPLKHPLRSPNVPTAYNKAPHRYWLYFLPRDTAEKPSTLADAAPITGLDEPAPGGGWLHEWKGMPQVAADGTVVIGAVVAVPPARFDAYYVYRPATKDKTVGTLAGPVVASARDKHPVYAGATEFFTLGAPAFDEGANLLFAAEPASQAVTFTPDFGLYRLPRLAWESSLTGANTTVFPLPTPTRLLGVNELDPVASPDMQIDGNLFAPAVDGTGSSIIVRARVRGELSMRLYEARLQSSGGAPAVRLIAGGTALGPDGSPWHYLDPSVLRGPEGRVFVSGTTERGQYDGTCVWSLQPSGGGSVVVNPKMRLNNAGMFLSSLSPFRMVNRSGVFVFSYGTSQDDDLGGDGIAIATPR